VLGTFFRVADENVVFKVGHRIVVVDDVIGIEKDFQRFVFVKFRLEGFTSEIEGQQNCSKGQKCEEET
jgi:hypothetical protein